MPDDLPRDLSSGFKEIESNPFMVESDDDISLAGLNDLDGVGPATVRNLRDAGVQDPSDLYGLSQDQIAAVDGIGPSKAAMLRRQVAQRGNRQKSGFRNDDIEKATKQHADRSPEARNADESFNAKTSLSYQQWSDAPGQYDMPGVDTIPADRRLARSKEAAKSLGKAGVLDKIEAGAKGPSGANVTGEAIGGTVKVKTAQNDPESTLAHELGHQADLLGGEPGDRVGFTKDLFGSATGEVDDEKQQKLRKQGAKLASRRRSLSLKPEVIEEKAEQNTFGGGGFEEVFADAFAEAIEEPRRAKSEAPDLLREMKREYQEQKDGFETPF